VEKLISFSLASRFCSVVQVRKHTKAPVGLHPGDNMLWSALPIQCAMLGMPAPKTQTSPPDVELKDGMDLPVRGGKVIHTPGHSPGSCCFYFAQDSLLCSGDTLFRQSIGRTDLMGGDSKEIVRSIQQKLYTLPPDTQVIPGHGPSTDILFESKYNGVVRAAKEKL
jgi:hydroxyacylglutathione hydrolase